MLQQFRSHFHAKQAFGICWNDRNEVQLLYNNLNEETLVIHNEHNVFNNMTIVNTDHGVID